MIPETNNVMVQKIWQADPRTLGIEWTDQQTSFYDAVELRRRCPCASCIDEWSRAPRLKAEDVADTVRPLRIDSVGRYALSVKFSDGHSTGIYTFQMLRKLAKCTSQNQ